MVEEYRDGHFGDIKELKKKLTDVAKMPPEQQEQVKAVHVGTEEELERLIGEAQKNTLEHRMEQLEKKVNVIMIHLGIDDKSEILVVKGKPTANNRK